MNFENAYLQEFYKIDPFLVIKRGNTTIHKTSTVKNDLNPVWTPFDIKVADCGSLTELLSFEVYDEDTKKKFVFFIFPCFIF